jgi:hypothetical protein
VYKASPTRFGLARAARAGASGKTPRAAADRVKTDQRDAELLGRLRTDEVASGELLRRSDVGPPTPLEAAVCVWARRPEGIHVLIVSQEVVDGGDADGRVRDGACMLGCPRRVAWGDPARAILV